MTLCILKFNKERQNKVMTVDFGNRQTKGVLFDTKHVIDRFLFLSRKDF